MFLVYEAHCTTSTYIIINTSPILSTRFVALPTLDGKPNKREKNSDETCHRRFAKVPHTAAHNVTTIVVYVLRIDMQPGEYLKMTIT